MDSTPRSRNAVSIAMFIFGCGGIGLFFFGDQLKTWWADHQLGDGNQREVDEARGASAKSKRDQPDARGQNKAATRIKSDLPNVNSFQRQVFTNPPSGYSISLVTATQCEIEESGQTFVAEYSKQGDKLRIVINNFGNSLVHYYAVEPDGIREVKSGKPGGLYLNAEAFARFNEEARQAAREAEQKRIKAERERVKAEAERIVREKAERTRKIEEETEWLRTFFEKGAVLSGSVNGKKFEFVAHLDVKFEPTKWTESSAFGGETVQFIVPGELKWTDGEPWTLLNDGKKWLTYSVAFYGQFSPWDEFRVPRAKLLYFSRQKESYINAGYEAAQKGDEFRGQGGFNSFSLRKQK